MKVKICITSIFIVTVILIISCRKKMHEPADETAGGPVLPSDPYDYANGDANIVTLGRVLFYDRKLSLNNSVACGSCHQQAKAFCDNNQFSAGLEDLKTKRNTPGIFARSGNLFWDGRAGSLNALVLMPIKNHVEMNFGDINTLIEKISKIDYYPALFKKAFGTNEVDSFRIKSALVSFVNNFNFSSNKFNRSQLNMENLDASESVGETIFFGKGRCSKCHHIVDPNPGSGSGYGSVPPLPENKFNIGLEMVYSDPGIGAITNDAEDIGKFMVPVLLNVEFTAPYMHDGRYKSLEEVVEHYSSGINNHVNLDIKLRDIGALASLSDAQQLQALDLNHNGRVDAAEAAPYSPVKLNLSSSEKSSLVDFLKTLSDPTIFSEKKFSDPFK